MYYLRYKLYNPNNATLEKFGDKFALLDFYRAELANVVVMCQLWHSELGFQYTII